VRSLEEDQFDPF